MLKVDVGVDASEYDERDDSEWRVDDVKYFGGLGGDSELCDGWSKYFGRRESRDGDPTRGCCCCWISLSRR